MPDSHIVFDLDTNFCGNDIFLIFCIKDRIIYIKLIKLPKLNVSLVMKLTSPIMAPDYTAIEIAKVTSWKFHEIGEGLM